MQIDIKQLEQRVKDSRFLNPQEREGVLSVLPNLTQAQAELISRFLETAPTLRMSVFEDVIRPAAVAKDVIFFAELDALLAQGSKQMRVSEEQAQREDDFTQTETLFDQV